MVGKRICLIGAGPSGMSVLYQAEKLRKKGRNLPEIVCYEKQSNWGGLWNYTWRTGLDEYGEPVHSSMYRHLWSNGPKEALELPDYTFEDHYGKPIASFPSREVLFDYLKGRWKKEESLRKCILFNHVVRNVDYNDSTDNFTVVAKNLKEDKLLPPEVFDYVVVASGHFSTPNVPSFPGIETFPGIVLHAHDFRDAEAYRNKRLLMIGSSYSAEDLALQCAKYGASSIVCTWRTKPMGFKWPSTITERPLLTKIEGSTCHFKDGSNYEADCIIQCTGYQISYPFLSENLRLRGENLQYLEGLYKGILWTGDGKGKLFYVGAQNEYYTFTMFDVQALWVVKYIIGDMPAPDCKGIEEYWACWVERRSKLKDCHDEIDFQTEFLDGLAEECNYGYNLDCSEIFHQLEHDKEEDILTYRDKSFASNITGTQSPFPHCTFMNAFDDSINACLGTSH
ncbi:trimethylamine monooxygenase-like [Rhopilema esculentum]|uniref:trimethylamine monooxygenase-like n=1 Tax=Rhopilema esculentum TaxID=499914 RepID=UPI0031D9C96F|eukprot:gene12964-3727_t